MGEISEVIRKKAFGLCRDFLGGVWTEVGIDKFRIVHISGGLSNLLYMCSIELEKLQESCDQPLKVMLRLYGQIIQENPETVVTDSVIFALLAEQQMGPKLYGVFTEGRVEEYIPSRHLDTPELAEPAISKECARKMARFHTLKMPLVKKPSWLFTTMHRYLDDALPVLASGGSTPEQATKLQKISTFNIAAELQCLENILAQVHSPVVFCHNDMQEGNILIMNEGKNFSLMPIDFEYASYNYRGFDFGNHFCEWCYDYWVDVPPYFEAKIGSYPSREQQLRFFRAYLEELELTADSDTEESMLLEANAFALASHFLWGLWSIVQASKSKIRFHYLDYALTRFKHYYQQKAELPSKIQVNGVAP